MIIFQPLFGSQQPGQLLGNLFLVISTMGVITGTILAKEIIKSYQPITLAFWAFAIGTITFFPFFLIDVLRVGTIPPLTYHGIIGILFGSVFSSLTAYFFFFWALKYFPASETGVFTYLDPVVTIMIAIPLLHETLTTSFFIGSFLIFFGIYVAENRFHYHPIHKLLPTD